MSEDKKSWRQRIWDRFFAFEDPTDRTASGWQEWEEYHKARTPVKYWLAETLPDTLTVYYRRFVIDPIWWVRYRTTDRNHVLKISTLPRAWTDRDTRILHACFQLLVDYVELELGGKRPCHGWIPYYLNIFPIRRNAEKGIEHLDWEINEPDCAMGPTPTQADRAREKKELYLWWTMHRPARLDPWEDPLIWSHVKSNNDDFLDDKDKMREWSLAADKAEALDHTYNEEDNEMLDRLIKIRHSLWS